jgi:hypothetical protein
MAGTFRHQAVIEAPIDDVWAVVSDPLTHPEWWPDVIDVRIEEPLVEGGEYVRSSKLMPFLDAVEDVWVADRLDQLREARFRCTKTGTWAHFSLTPAQSDTFVELETGMDPTRFRWRLMKAISGSYFKGWILDVLEALPREVLARRGARRE